MVRDCTPDDVSPRALAARRVAKQERAIAEQHAACRHCESATVAGRVVGLKRAPDEADDASGDPRGASVADGAVANTATCNRGRSQLREIDHVAGNRGSDEFASAATYKDT